MHQSRAIVTMLGAAALLSATVLAQQGARAQTQPAPQQQGQQTMSMDGMMKMCREHCEMTTKSVDQVSKVIQDAKASNDVTKMRAALDQTQKPLAEIRDHMAMCMKMMDMMGSMGNMPNMPNMPNTPGRGR